MNTLGRRRILSAEVKQAHGDMRITYAKCKGIFPHNFNGHECQVCEREYLMRTEKDKVDGFGVTAGKFLIAVGEWLVMKFGG